MYTGVLRLTSSRIMEYTQFEVVMKEKYEAVILAALKFSDEAVETGKKLISEQLAKGVDCMFLKHSHLIENHPHVENWKKVQPGIAWFVDRRIDRKLEEWLRGLGYEASVGYVIDDNHYQVHIHYEFCDIVKKYEEEQNSQMNNLTTVMKDKFEMVEEIPVDI